MLRTALRNISRNQRRTIVTTISVVLATFLVCSLRFLGYGMHQQMVWQTAGILSGYAQISAHGWLESGSIERALDVPDSLLKRITAMPGVMRVAPRIEGPALVAVRSESRFVKVTALDPVLERGVTGIATRIVSGRYLSGAVHVDRDGDVRQAVLGEGLAKLLGLSLGDTFFLITTQFDGSVGAARAALVGVFRTHNAELDYGRVLVGLETGRELYAPDGTDGKPKRYTSLLLGVRTQRSAEELLSRLKAAFPVPKEPGIPAEESQSFVPVAHGWEELNPDLVQMMALDQLGNEMWIAFLILIMAFGILNSVHMSINERTREFGVLLAIGFRPHRLLLLVILETLLVLIQAAFVGTLLGIAGAAYLQANPIPLTGEMASYFEGFGFQPVVQSVVDLGELSVALISLFLPALGFVYFGARRVLKLEPAKILRTA